MSKGHGTSLDTSVSVDDKQRTDPAFNLDLNPDLKLIILLTSFRGGSSFLGSIFDVNPKVQYLYEPFHGGHVQKNLYEKGRIVGARVDHTASDLKMLFVQQILHNCSVFGTPFPEKYEFCGTPDENLYRFNSTTCDRKLWGRGSVHHDICRYRNVIVMKVIRLPDLADILKISKIRLANIFIVHHLRNPSPVLMSRRTGGNFFKWRAPSLKSLDLFRGPRYRANRRLYIAWEAFNYCQDNIKSWEFAKGQPWLKNRYLQVTHRDLSLQPLQTAQKIYDFLNETLTKEVKESIVSMTNGSRDTSDTQMINYNPLEVRKNSTDVVDAWKKFYAEVYYWDITAIEAQCKLLFNFLGDDTLTVDRIPTSKLKKIYFVQTN